MKIFIKVKPRAKKDKLEKMDENHFIGWTKEPPQEGRANLAIARLIAGYFGVSVSRIKIISGFKSKQKIVEIN